MFGGHFVYRYCLSVALFSASFTLSVSLTQQQEFHRKNFTSPLIEGRTSLVANFIRALVAYSY